MDILACILLLIIISLIKVTIAVDTILLSQSISDGMTLVSQGEKFELGFFSLPYNSSKRYLGIWYKNIPTQTVVWVANDVNAINDSSGILTLNSTGNLVLKHDNKVVWYTTTSHENAQNPVAQLLDSGNLVVRDENEEGADANAYLWQSFDYPSDTILPGMKFGWNLRTGMERRMTSWKSPDDPSPGSFYAGSLLYNYPEQYLMQGTQKYVRIGPWNGLHYSGIPDQKPNPIFDYKFVYNKDEMYYMYTLKNDSVITRMTVANRTTLTYSRYVWMEDKKMWNVHKSLPKDSCDLYAMCGAYGTCTITGSQICQCLSGFSPKSPAAWNTSNWSQGCVRNKPLNCTNKHSDGFVKVEGVKVPDSTHTWVDEKISLDECRVKCLNNCTCMAYTNYDISGEGSGCVLWFGDLIDIRQFLDAGQDLYVRMDATELGIDDHGRKKELIRIVASTILLSVVLSLGYYLYIVRRRKANNSEISDLEGDSDRGSDDDDMDLPVFEYSTIVTATDKFSIKKKIGEGGFGPVYKGRLICGQEIAVKRLSSDSGQGIREFKNEVRLIAKLQHRNLVKLLGCCIQDEDRMLVYEYMTNSSLDKLIFDDTKSKLLDWPKRFNIILGIARGLLYLHQDSRLRIIHRDLKPSNILLDHLLIPKISDFGIARIFGGDETQGNTKRVVGTYGYMAPEYAVDGLFSVKSDVFSFGILMLEIICRKRSRGFYVENDSPNLVTHAWSLWKEGRSLELIDQNIEDSCDPSAALRFIHVSLLCVQQYPEDRPVMPYVVLMLGSDIELAEPKTPGYYVKKASFAETSSSGLSEKISTNDITITLLDAR